MQIADIFASVRLNLETGKFETDALKSTALVTGKMEASLKRAAGGLLGAGLGAGMAMMVTGANQLDAATRQLQADTGMTADEANRAQDSLASMYRDNLQGFDAIGAAMAKVHNDLGLVGDAATAATEKFLRFSTATGQDAAAAVASFDDILDAWNLTADDAGGLMDKLIVSHQKYGGVISESQAALTAMAPAMQAANMSIDDGIALLNLFNAAGIDAAKAPAALAKAVKLLKPGQSLDDLIAQIGAIEDPTLRAQEAMRIFGARSGIGMAQAIQPGMDSLDDLTASLGDTAGATDKAADAIESGFGAQFQLLLKNAGGALAEFGTNFGGILMVASAFGPAFLTKMGAAFGGIAGFFGPKLLGLILPQAIATGTAAGTATGTAFGTAAAAALVIPITAALAALAGLYWLGLQNQNQPNPVPDSNLLAAQAMGGVLPSDPRSAIGAWKERGELLAEAERNAFRAGERETWAAPADGAEEAGSKAAEAVASGFRLTAQKEVIGAEDVFGLFGTSVDGVRSAAFSTGIAGMEAMAAGITAARSKPVDAFTTMKDMLKNAMTPTQEAARLAGQLTSKELAAGLRSGDPAVKAQAIAVRRTIIDRLAEIAKDSGPIGGKAMDALGAGVRSKDSVIRSAAGAARTAVLEELNGTKAGARTAGANAGAAFVAGLLSRIPAFLRKAIEAQLHAAGVPGYAVGAWSVPATTLATVHAGEMIIPAAPSAAIRAGQATVTAQGVVPGRTQNINIEQVDIRDAHDEFSLIQQLRFLAAVG